MKFFKFLVSTLLTFGLLYALSNQLIIKGNQIPAFGKLLNPFTGFWQNGDGGNIFSNEKSFKIPSVKGKANVVFDDRQVPHIFADNNEDAIRIQGYLHAKDRLFQMDISSRSAAGRLAEVVGEIALDADKLERKHGMALAAEVAAEGWKKNPAMYKLIEAYAEGVNTYIGTLTDKTLPVEYKVLNFKPEKWSVLHTALFFKSMCRTLARGELDAEMSNSQLKLGQNEFQKLFPERHPSTMPIVPNGTRWNFKAMTSNLAPATNASLTQIIDKPEDGGNKETGIGSNNWVVSGSKTQSGKAILCGDPHLTMTLPSIWYEMQITTPDFNTYGVSIPGMPFIAIGFNNDIAWTQTNSQHDVADWYRMEWKDASKKEYKLDGKYEPVTERIEEIKVKGGATVREVVKYTKFGPIAFEDGSSVRNDLAFHWIAAEQSTNDITTFYELAKAKNFDEFSNALKNYAFPMQNYAFACKNGDIAIRTQGWLPIKPKGSGSLVLDGTSSNNLWKGYAPFEHMPYVKNPSSGFVVSANQNTTDENYPYYYNSRQFDNFRSRRINKLLSENKKFSIDDLRAMQLDVYGLEAEEYLPILLERIDYQKLNDADKAVVESLKTWDFKYSKDSKAAMYFSAWMEKLKRTTWDDLYTVEEPSRLAPKNTAPPKPKPNPYAIPALWRTVQLIKDEPNSKHFDIMATPEVEHAGSVLAISLSKTVADIAQEILMNLDPTLDYGKYKNTTINHIARIPGFGNKLYTGGNENAINATKTLQGPSWRMVVEMGDTPHAYIVYPGGESGNPGSKNYDEFVTRWEKGEHYEAIFMKNVDEKNERIKKVISVN